MNKNVLKPLKIGNVKLKNNLVLAPMAGITDQVFRILAKEGGAGLVCTEMLSSNALAHNDKKTNRMMVLSKEEHPVSVQIFGSSPEIMADSAKMVEESGADIVDINFGCPVNKIIKSGAGAKLLENEDLMKSIIDTVVKSVKIPVTIKMRIGNVKDENVAPRVIKIAQEHGVSAVAVHGRAAEFKHAGSPDLEAVKEAVKASKIPVIGNGGIVDEVTAGEFLEKTGCDGIIIKGSLITLRPEKCRKTRLGK
jgi:tRNA-dihydrouridine synthase B